ncbi:MAG: hypothetical protein MI753_03820 [Hyphomicrobiales bacterium]|nr:hypothetical protein [Hyphomicrobiales bacterium]
MTASVSLKSFALVCALTIGGVTLAGCHATTRTERAVVGGAIGAAAGAGVAAAAGGSVATGAVVGGATGAVVGAVTR